MGAFDDKLIGRLSQTIRWKKPLSRTREGNLPTDEDMVEDPDDRGFERCRKRDGNGKYVGRKHKNPVLNSTVYEIEFLGGERQEIAYNILAENLLSQVDEEGKQCQIFRDIIGHRRGYHYSLEYI
jgi:hypothetical protein